MGKNQSASNLTNVIQVSSTGNVLFVSGSTTLMSISSSGAITTTGVISGSNALSASYAANADTLDGLDSTVFTLTSSFNAQTASFTAFTASILAQTASLNAFSASVLTFTGSASTRLGALESYTSSLNNKTASFATTGSNTFIGTQTITGSVLQSGSFTSTGTLTAQTLVVQTITSSVVYSSGSNVFGNAIGNTQTFTGSMLITGSNIIANVGAACFSGTVCNSNTVINGSVSTPLSLTGTNTVTTFNINNINASGWGGGISVQTNTTSSFYLQTLGSLLGSTNQDATLWATAGNGVRIYTNGNNLRLNIDSTGVACFASTVCAPNMTLKTTSDGFNMMCLVATGGDAGIYLRGGATNTGGWTIQAQNSCNLIFVDRTAGSNPVRMAIASGGNVGIGCSAPDIKLVLVAPVSNAAIMAIRSTTANNLFNFISNGTEGHSILDMGRCTESGTFAGAYIRFRTDGDSWIQGGSVGIGTSTPNARLDLGGSYGSSGEKFFIYNDNTSSALAGTKVGFYMDRFSLSNNSTYVFPTYPGYDGSFVIASKDTSTTTLCARVAVRGESGNVGIGTVSPNSRLEIQKTSSQSASIFINQCSSDEATIRFKSTHSAGSDYRVGASILFDSAWEVYNPTVGRSIISVSPCGAVQLGNTATSNTQDPYVLSTDPVHKIGYLGGGTAYARLMMQERAGCWISFNNGSGINYGIIMSSGAGVSYGSNSDYRLKINIQNMASSCGLNRIMCLRPVTFDWIQHCIQGEGFIAHELQEYIPNAVTGEKDAVNEHGYASYQSVDAKNIVPSLVKAIQEQQCTICTQASRITLLESCLGIA